MGKAKATVKNQKRVAKPKVARVAPDVASPLVKVSYGEVSVMVRTPTNSQVEKSVKASSALIMRLGRKLASPGVQLQNAKNIPLFTADHHDPNVVVRDLNGVRKRGRFVGGVFKPL